MTSNNHIRAIIWDYDGTLADTRMKNLSVTRKIIDTVSDTDATEFEALQSLENYQVANQQTSNWRELYRLEFNFSEDQIDRAGRLWTEYQLKDDTTVSLYDGIDRVIRTLSRFPLGIVSQNARQRITQDLEESNLISCFEYIVGYEEVGLKKQKPHPDGLLWCMDKLSKFKPGLICYVGDHETDVQCVSRANQVLKAKGIDVKIISIGAFYDFRPDLSTWEVLPDYEARKVEDILDIVEKVSS